MLDSATIIMVFKEMGVTLYMTFASTIFAYILGLPMGIMLVVSAKGGLHPSMPIYKGLDFISNILRSIPFLILLILVSPITKMVVGKSYGPSATVVPLVIAAAPFVARLVESSLQEVDKGVIEAAQSMGANNFTIVGKVLLTEARTSLIVGVTIALGTILGYSAMAGIVGGGGLGDIAIRYGYYRSEEGMMIVAVVLLVLLMQLLQWLGIKLSKKLDKRIMG